MRTASRCAKLQNTLELFDGGIPVWLVAIVIAAASPWIVRMLVDLFDRKLVSRSRALVARLDAAIREAKRRGPDASDDSVGSSESGIDAHR